MSVSTGVDAWRLSAIDPPERPAKGMKFWVQVGTHWSIGQGYSISRVNSRSFYVATDGRTERHPLVAWHEWLRRREGEGRVLLDGHPLRPLRQAPLSDGLRTAGGSDEGPPDDGDEEVRMGRRRDRDARILRAVRDVVRGYALSEGERDGDGTRTFHLARGRSRYTIAVDPSWRRPPTCDCPDAVHRVADGEGGVFCKHVVATLVQREELRHQLIDLFL